MEAFRPFTIWKSSKTSDVTEPIIGKAIYESHFTCRIRKIGYGKHLSINLFIMLRKLFPARYSWGRTVKASISSIFAMPAIRLSWQNDMSRKGDRLVFLDITATIEKRKTLTDLVNRIAHEINIPFTVGGGIDSLEDARSIIKARPDKVSINSSAVKKSATHYRHCANLAVSAWCLPSTIPNSKTENGRFMCTADALPHCTQQAEWAKTGEQLGASAKYCSHRWITTEQKAALQSTSHALYVRQWIFP